MTSAFAGRLPLNPPVIMAVANHDGTTNNNGEGGTVLDQQLERMRHRDCRTFRYMFLYCVILDDLNRFRVVGEQPAEAALKIGRALQKYGMNTVQKLELSGDHNGGGGKKMNVDGILRFLEQSPSLREFCYASQDKYLPPLYLKALQQNHHHILQRLELRCSYLPMEPLSDLIRSTKTLSYLSLDGNVHINRPYHISHQHLKTLCLALSANKSLKEVSFLIMDFNHRNQNNTRKKLFTQQQNKTIETVRFRNGTADAHSVYNLLHVMGNVKNIEWTYMGRHDHHLLDALSNIRMELQDVMLTEAWTAATGGVELTLRKKTTQPLNLQIKSHTGHPIDPTVMRNFVQSQQSLSSLSLDYGTAQSLQDFVMMSSKVLADHPNLKSLSLKNAGDAGVKYLNNVPLVKLDFSAWAMEDSVSHLCHLLSQQDCTVQELTVCLHTLEGFGNLCVALKENRSIKTFSLTAEPKRPNHRPIDEYGYESLYRCLPDFSIEHLSFSGPGIQREFTHWLFRALERNGNDYLKALDIESLEAGLLEMESIVLLCRYLHQPGCRLSTLTLNCGAIPDLTPDGMELLLLRLSSAPTPVENLSLSCNSSDLKTISDYIPRIRTLKKLSLLVFNDQAEAWRSEKLKIDILISIELSQSLSEFHCNMDEESHFFQNRIFFFNQRRKIDRISGLSDHKQPSLRLWPKIMEALQQENNCPSLLFHLLTSHSDTLFSRARRRATTSRREPIQEQHPASLEDKKRNEPSPETAPPLLGHSSEVVSYSGCGCLPFFGWW